MRLAPKRSQRVVQLAFGQPAARGDEAVLATRGSELREGPRLLEREIERQISGERGDGHVEVRVGDHVDEMAGKEAGCEAQNEGPAPSRPRGGRGALPDPARQHGLDGQAHAEVESEKRPGLRREQARGQDTEMISVFGEDQGVEEEKADPGAGQEDAQRQDQSRARDQRDHGNHQQEHEAGEGREVTDVGDDDVDPCERGPECEVVPEIAQSDDGHERAIADGEPAPPAEQPSSCAHGHYGRFSFRSSSGAEYA